MTIRYTHTNIIARDWRKLAQFYQIVFHCLPLAPERDLSGDWLSEGTGVYNAALQGIHLRLPGYGNSGPTLEIFSYDEMLDKLPPAANRQGIAHLAFSVDNVQACLQKVIEHGGQVIGKVVTRQIYNVGLLTFAYATDPESNILEIQHWDSDE
ncbi:MAG: VOC family protein [Anaerolineae bacterium]|nr:VOC family protein [Anaerolineae bacterium]